MGNISKKKRLDIRFQSIDRETLTQRVTLEQAVHIKLGVELIVL
jgi:hypothetical protein